MPLLLAIVLASCASPAPEPPAARAAAADADDAEFQRQHARYLALCANCHGADWMGGLGGSLVDGKWRRGGEPDEIFHSIKVGYPDSGMPGYGATLSDDDIRAMVAYLHEAGRRHAAQQLRKAETPPDGTVDAGGERVRIETVAAGLDTPWAMAWLSDGRMLVTERPGRLRIVDADGRVSPPVAGTPAVFARNQGGLLDVAVHPRHADNGWIYLSYSQPRDIDGETVAFTAIVRGRLRDGAWVDQQTVFEAADAFHTTSEKHWGCKLAFDGDGHLFFGIGDRGKGEHAQDLRHPAGKIHRVHDDGRVPRDNPYAGRDDALPTLWAHGVRNPQGLAFDAAGRLWQTEHGPRGGDEFNRIERGRDYGWPRVSRGRNYDFAPVKWRVSAPDVAEPLLSWSPSIGASGLAHYDGEAFPRWRGAFLAGGLVGERLERVVVVADGSARGDTLLQGLGRIRDVRVGPDGFVYLALNHRGRDDAGRIVRLRPAR